MNLNFTGVDGLVLNYNCIGGPEAGENSVRSVHEINFTYAFNPTVSIASDLILGHQQTNNQSIGDVKWSAITFYLKAQINDIYSISPRLEFFDDSEQGYSIAGFTPGIKQKFTALTLSHNFNLVEGAEVRLEVRVDKSDSDQFFKNNEGFVSRLQNSFTAAILYNF